MRSKEGSTLNNECTSLSQMIHTFSTLLANSLGCLVKPFKSRNLGRSERSAIEPGNEADEIDRGSNAKVLHMRFRQSQIARATQVKGTHSPSK